MKIRFPYSQLVGHLPAGHPAAGKSSLRRFGVSNLNDAPRSVRPSAHALSVVGFYAVGLLCIGQQIAWAQTPPAQNPPRFLTGEMPDMVPVPAKPAPTPTPSSKAKKPEKSAVQKPVTPAPTPVAPTISVPTPAAAPIIALPAAPKINVLILAFDDVNPAPFSPIAPLPLPALAPDAAFNAPLPPLVVPALGISAPPALLAPTAWQKPVVRWESSAQKRDPDDKLFLPIPEPSNSTIGRRSQKESSTIAANGGQTRLSNSLTPLNPVPQQPVDLFPPSMTTGRSGTLAAAQPGRSQLAASALRRALTARGYGDVLSTGPDGVTVIRALGERRLSPRALGDLKRGLAGLAMPGTVDPTALNASIQAASRVGQALGYQAIVALYVTPPVAGSEGGVSKSSWAGVLVDSTRERGEPLLFDESAVVASGDENALLDAGAATGAGLLDKSLQKWLPPSNADKVGLAAGHLATARAALASGDLLKAQDDLNQTLALDPTRGEAYVLLGDSLRDSDPQGAATAYRRAVELDTRDGATWAKISQAYANATPPDYPRALEAGRRALATGYDTVDLRVAMATAQYGRASLFRNADRISQAEDAELEAKTHLDRALALAPDNPSAVRLLANTLISQNRYKEAIQTLDRIAPRFPNDAEIQRQYAQALSNQLGREEDTFVAYSRVWKVSGQKAVNVEPQVYRTLAQGFDLRLFNLGKVATQLSAGVAGGAVAREAALLQLTKLKEDMSEAETAINTVQAPLTVGASVAASRVFAADLMNQALEAHQAYLETGQPIYRSRGLELYRQAVARLNVARNSG